MAGWSPDGKIGAIFKRPAETGLYTLSAKGGKAVQVARGGRIPRWFPDGTRIACVDSPKNSKGVWRGRALGSVPAEGGTFVAIPLQSDTEMGLPGFGVGNRVSPDGSMIAYNVIVGNSDIYMTTSKGGNRNQLTDNPADDLNPRWSPDGSKIAFVSDRGSGTNVYWIPSSGGAERKIAETGLPYLERFFAVLYLR